MKNLPRVALLIESSRSYGRELVRGMTRYSRTQGLWVFYRKSLFYLPAASDGNELTHIKDWKPDAIVTRDSENLEEMSKWAVPIFVSCAVRLPDIRRNNIITDDAAIGRMAAEHFLERGFINFAYCGFDDMFWSRQRGESFKGRLAREGNSVQVYRQPKTQAQRSWDREQSTLGGWLASLTKPVAVMACNDDRGQQVAEACAMANVDIPYEAAVIGVDNDDQVCDICTPPLSSVALNVEMAGFTAARLLHQMIQKKKKMKPQTVVVQPSRVVTRLSTDVMAVGDETVAVAVRFIRENANRLIQVEDVLRELNLSRRSLDEKFSKALGCSVHEEIKRIRLELIKQMLLETDLSVMDIAYNLGYQNADHIARYFKQKVGSTPREYRKLHGHQ